MHDIFLTKSRLCKIDGGIFRWSYFQLKFSQIIVLNNQIPFKKNMKKWGTHFATSGQFENLDIWLKQHNTNVIYLNSGVHLTVSNMVYLFQIYFFIVSPVTFSGYYTFDDLWIIIYLSQIMLKYNSFIHVC